MHYQGRLGRWGTAGLARGKRAGLVLVLAGLALAAYVPGPAAAYAPPPPALLLEHCSDTGMSAQLNRSCGTFSDCWAGDFAQAAAPSKDVLSSNPELLLTRWYSGATLEVGAEAAFLAANPEVMFACR
jgi:hypothetical protein